MTETLESWVKRLGSWTLPSRAALLSGTLALFYALVAPLAWWLHGGLGFLAASLAGGHLSVKLIVVFAVIAQANRPGPGRPDRVRRTRGTGRRRWLGKLAPLRPAVRPTP